jgi:hypothetical protein
MWHADVVDLNHYLRNSWGVHERWVSSREDRKCDDGCDEALLVGGTRPELSKDRQHANGDWLSALR